LQGSRTLPTQPVCTYRSILSDRTARRSCYSSKAESRKIFEAFAAAGGNFIDTANNYTDGVSEQYVGEFVAAERDRFVVATKYTLWPRKGDPNAGGNQWKNMVQWRRRS
jgi:aryl-alcohol dehydrogenase-like predicted oxidoreductase